MVNAGILELAVKNIRKRGLRSWLTMLGIFIGIAAVISLISLGQGLQNAVMGQFSNLGTDKLTVTSADPGFGPPGSGAVRKLNSDDVKLIERVNGVKLVSPRLLRVARVEYNDYAKYRYIIGFSDDEKELKEAIESLNIEAMQGKLLDVNDYGKIVLGNDYVRAQPFHKEIRVGTKLKIENKTFTVQGILEPASSFQINSIIMMTGKDLKEILEIGDEYDIIGVTVEDSDKINEVAEKIEEKMRKDRNQKEGKEDFSVETPAKVMGSVNSILIMINVVVAGIAAISLLIGGIGIANTMFTSVIERTREIGVMKSVGAENWHITTLFLYEAALLGLAGGIIGILIGLGIAFGVAAAANSALGGALDFKVAISLPLIFATATFSLVVGMISGIVPAIQASKLQPAEALRQ